jgi:hypothetical protein
MNKCDECALESCEDCPVWIMILKEEQESLEEFWYLENINIPFG